MIELYPITRANALVFKSVRLRALQDTPTAFGATYANDSKKTDAEWIARAEQLTTPRWIGFIAMDGQEACGMVIGALDEKDPSRAHLMAMWTAPTHRRRGVGRKLVDGVVTWARGRGANEVELTVTSNNDSAKRFYEQLGFEITGETKPYPNDPNLVEFVMILNMDK